MNINKCKHCDADVATTAKICPKCGANLKAQRREDPYISSVFTKFIICEISAIIGFIGIIVGYFIYNASDRRLFSLSEWIERDHTLGTIFYVVGAVIFIIAFINERKYVKILRDNGAL